MRDKRIKAQIKKKKTNYEIIPTPCPPHPHPDINQPPPTYPIPPSFIITMQWTEFLVQMRQSNKYGSVRHDEIFNLHLGSGMGS